MSAHILNITLSDALYETLTRTARQTGQPLEAVAAKWLAAAAEQFAHDPLDRLIGAVASGGTDWADNHDHYLGQMVADDMRVEQQ